MAVLGRTRRADRDLIDIWRYIVEHDPGAADRMLRALDAKMVLLSENPRLGPARPDIAEGLRCFPVGRYVLLYREIAGGVEIVRCVHGARDLFALSLSKR